MAEKKMHAAFSDFDRIHQLIERAAARIARTLDLPCWMEYDDLVQEGFLIACEAVDRWDPDRARFTTYLYLHLDLFLRRAIQRRLPAQFEPLISEEDLERLESGEDFHESLEVEHTIRSMLGRLRAEAPRAHAVLIRFYGLEGYSPRPLSSIERDLGMRRGEGARWLEEGLSRLRQMWAEHPSPVSEG